MNHDSEDTIIRDSRPLESIETEEIGDAFGRGAVQHLPTRQPPLRVANSSNSSSVHGTAPTASKKHIWIVAGPSGSGKTAIAQFLASKLSFPYLEGDDVSLSSHWLMAGKH